MSTQGGKIFSGRIFAVDMVEHSVKKFIQYQYIELWLKSDIKIWKPEVLNERKRYS